MYGEFVCCRLLSSGCRVSFFQICDSRLSFLILKTIGREVLFPQKEVEEGTWIDKGEDSCRNRRESDGCTVSLFVCRLLSSGCCVSFLKICDSLLLFLIRKSIGSVAIVFRESDGCTVSLFVCRLLSSGCCVFLF